jgi:hypothetical protein
MSNPTPCFECGAPAEFNHHVVPQIYGGTKTIPLCDKCHSKVHDLNMLNHRALTKAGMAKAIANGAQVRGPNAKNPPTGYAQKGSAANCARTASAYAYIVPFMHGLRQDGASLRGIAMTLNGQGHTLRGGGPWTAIQVKRVLDRYSS